MTEPRFSEEEFALVLRRATELQSRSLARAGAEPRTEGMSLEEMQGIAAEVGIDPALVERAAAAVAQERGSRDRPLADRFSMTDSAPGALTEEDKVRVLQAIREATLIHGEAQLTASGLEWSSPRGEPTQFHVSVHHLSGRNEVRVAADRSVAAGLSHIFPILGGFIASVATLSVVSPDSALVGAGIMAGGLGVGLAIARAIWRVSSRRSRERARDILRATAAALTGGVGV